MTPRDAKLKAEMVRRLTLGPLAEEPKVEAKAELAVPVVEKPKPVTVPAPAKK